MSGVSHPEVAGQDGGWMWLAGVVAAAALLIAGMWLARLMAPTEAADATEAGWLSPLAAAALAASAIGLARRGRRERRWQQGRLDTQRLVDLLDVWFWRTDRDHQLTLLRPPAQAADDQWQAARAAQAAQGALWSAFPPCAAGEDAGGDEGKGPDPARPVPAAPGALQGRLAAAAPLLDLAVSWPDAPGGQAEGWLLRGVPCFDVRGRFMGYEGTLRRTGTGAPAAAASATVIAAPGSAAGSPPEPAQPCHDPERADQEAFAYAVSHDLRAPLRVVEGFTRIVKEDYGALLDRIGNDHLDRVLGAATRMNGMIDALLEQARLSTQPMTREPVNLSQLALLVMDDLRRTCPERQADVEIEDGLWAEGDPLLLRLVLENLLGNAWKYSSCRQRAAIALRCERRSGADGRTPRIYCVSDNGVGFDARYAQRLFGMFQRLHSATDYPGTGVGLASVRRIIHRHGGEIWAESEVDRGSRFYFTLEGGAPPRGERH